MSKGNRRVKDVSGQPVSSHNRELAAINAIDFQRAWHEARMYDSNIPVNPPRDTPEVVKLAITVLARRVLKLESEWS